MIHKLKTWRQQYEDTLSGRKKLEVRYGGDRRFAEGDILQLEEWDPEAKVYTGRALQSEVTYIVNFAEQPEKFRLPRYHPIVVMQLSNVIKILTFVNTDDV